MKKFAYLLSVVAVTTGALTGCAAGADNETESSESALTSLTPAQCQTPNVSTAPKTDSAGRPIDGTAKTTIKGCILGETGETGANVIARASALLNDTAKFGQMTDDTGKPLFSRFTPQAPSGSLSSSSGLVQDIDVVLNVDYSPSARVRVTRRALSDGSYSVAITNVTAFKATILFFPVEVIKPGNLSLNVKLQPESNGITVNGTTEIQLEQQQEQAAQASQLVTDMFSWLKEELAR